MWIETEGAFARFESGLDPGLVVGDRTKVYTWTRFSLEADAFLEIGEDCVLVGALFMGASHISVGNRVVISYGVVIADSDFHPMDPNLRRLDAEARAPGGDPSLAPPRAMAPVRIDDGAVVGAGAIILKGVTIGAGAEVGAGAVVTRSVAPGARVAGNPARVVDDDAGALQPGDDGR